MSAFLAVSTWLMPEVWASRWRNFMVLKAVPRCHSAGSQGSIGDSMVSPCMRRSFMVDRATGFLVKLATS